MSYLSYIRGAMIVSAREFLTQNEEIQTIRTSFGNLPTIPAQNISWENRDFSVGSKNFFATVTYLPSEISGASLGPCGRDRVTGVLQISFHTAQNSGESLLLEWEKKASIFYHVGRKFGYSGQYVIVLSVSFSSGFLAQGFYTRSLSISFRSEASRLSINQTTENNEDLCFTSFLDWETVDW